MEGWDEARNIVRDHKSNLAEEGNQKAGLNVFTGNVVNTFDAGVIEPTHAKRQAVSSATEASNLILKIDDIIAAGDLGKSGGDMGEMLPGMM